MGEMGLVSFEQATGSRQTAQKNSHFSFFKYLKINVKPVFGFAPESSALCLAFQKK
jgi:hypothetical protein